MSKRNAILTAATGLSSQTRYKCSHSDPGSNPSEKINIELFLKVLLVDDEKEFVQTLSERLQMRNMRTAFVYDGKSALDLARIDTPEVMIVDLKMPGISGMEILKQIKLSQPEIKVIVLTGHGSEQDKKKCTDLGAFAYLQKPIDINLLIKTLKKAHENKQINDNI